VLEDVRVIETSMLAPSTLGMHLADLGADVIKVEDPALGDYVRAVKLSEGEEASPLHRHWNRGKRSIAVDLRQPGGVALFEDLVRGADIVIEGLRPGALARRGVGYERLREVNPSVVFVSISGFGQDGPYRDMASHGPAFEAYAGLAPPGRSANGLPRIPPSAGGVGIKAAPLLGALAALAAVIRARATGEGCAIDVAEADAAVYWNAQAVDDAADARWRRTRGKEGPAPPFGLPDTDADLFERATRCQYYETADGRYLIFMALERKFLENFARAVDRPDLLAMSRSNRHFDHEYANDELRQALAGILATRPLAEWMTLLTDADVPAIPVNVGEEILDDPHFVARTRWLDADAHRMPMMAVPVHTDAPLPLPRPAPALGEQTREILQDVLEYTPEQIETLAAAGVFGDRAGSGDHT
jgi:crotonobetainyl-CoA:carnitine CoA-transferase CaiB-like acyl-CoA transferase